MAESVYETIKANLNAVVALNFLESKKEQVGHITSLKFAKGAALEADTSVKDPTNPGSDIKVVGVMNRITWDGGETEKIYLEGWLSPKNAGLLNDALTTKDAGSDIEITFCTYKYDYDEQKYFQRFDTNNTAFKFIVANQTKVELEDEPIYESPTSFRFNVTLSPKPKGGVQNFNYAATATKKKTLPYGVAVAG